jgi:hypothetical protein
LFYLTENLFLPVVCPMSICPLAATKVVGLNKQRKRRTARQRSKLIKKLSTFYTLAFADPKIPSWMGQWPCRKAS